ncbi:unnamed protein product, partial [Adineta steineri]
LEHTNIYGSSLFRGIWEWGFLYKETQVPDQELYKRKYTSEPYWSPKHAGLISISDSLFSMWNKTSTCIEIQRGRAMINNNYFGDDIGNAMNISHDADKVTITNNQLNGNRLISVTKKTILIANNLA